VLAHSGPNTIELVRAVRDLTELGLPEIRTLIGTPADLTLAFGPPDRPRVPHGWTIAAVGCADVAASAKRTFLLTGR
jgi:hypothetical protein